MMSLKISQWGTVFAVLLTVSCLSGTVWAEGSAVPGRAVGHVFLGMDRADVWKILQKPHKTYTVPHGMSLYSDDLWTSGSHVLSVVSERDKVIQVEFDSPRITTSDGLSTRSGFTQVRLRHPSPTVRAYFMLFASTKYTMGTTSYCIDDERQGIAFTYQSDGGIEPQDIEASSPVTIIIHRSGYRVVPVFEGRWSVELLSGNDPNSMRVVRSWFTPSKAH